MMRIKLGISALLIFQMTLSTYGQKANAWTEFSSPEGKFRILFPGTPTGGMRHAGEDSPSSVTYITNLPLGQHSWTVAYFDEPAPLANAEAIKKLFDRTQKYRTRSEYHHLVNEKDRDYLGYPARDLKIRFDYDKKRVELTRLILVKQRVYEVTLVTATESTETEDVRRFFDSFHAQPLSDEERKALKSFSAEEKAKAVPKKVKVSGGVLQMLTLQKVSPTYPPEARQKGISGAVEVQILVSEEGKVIEAHAVKGPEELRQAAVEAAKQWTFKPAALGDHTVKMEGVLTFKFVL